MSGYEWYPKSQRQELRSNPCFGGLTVSNKSSATQHKVGWIRRLIMKGKGILFTIAGSILIGLGVWGAYKTVVELDGIGFIITGFVSGALIAGGLMLYHAGLYDGILRGRREVVEWMKSKALCYGGIDEETIFKVTFGNRELQAKLKEWGIIKKVGN